MECILIIDNDAVRCGALKEMLNIEGFSSLAVRDGTLGLREALSGDYNLVLLNEAAPPTDGFRVLREIRSHSDLPIMMMNESGGETEHIEALDQGADDYLLKPLHPGTLAARIRAILRRTGEPHALSADAHCQEDAHTTLGDIRIDTGTRIAYRDGTPIHLTSVEFNLLDILLKNAGQIVSREELAAGALGRSLGMNDRSIDVHISSLRKKLGHYCSGMDRIKTVRNLGYLYSRPCAT